MPVISLENRIAGLLWGAFVAESLSLGVHWNYDPHAIREEHGLVTDFLAPGPKSYHPHKQAGDQGHVGDQSLLLLRHLQTHQAWDLAAFFQTWLGFWPSYTDYVDKATKTTLAGAAEGKPAVKAASASDELAGPARIAPLVAFFARKSAESLIQSCFEQTILTHHSQEALASVTFLSASAVDLLAGKDLEKTLLRHAPSAASRAVQKHRKSPPETALPAFGLSCAGSQALPAVIYLALRYPDDPETAFIANAMAGGDNCARGLALGMLLGAACGKDAIPKRWRDGLRAGGEVDAFLRSVCI